MSIPKSVKIKNKKLPTMSGVYLFRDKKGKVVYVGKASSLKSRVRHYFQGTDSHGFKNGWPRITDPRVAQLVSEVRRIDYVVTDSVIEALILEANLIKKYQPRYNVREKDDTSFLYVVVTKEQWPKVMLVRGSELVQYRHSERSEESRGSKDGILRSPRDTLRMTGGEVWKMFGPYTNASALRAALDLIRRWFPWGCMTRSTTKRKNKVPRKPCFDYHIGRCPGVCIGAISRREYMKNIRNVILMLQGKKKKVMQNVKLKMQNEAKREHFEEAEKLRRKLFALQHIRDVAVIAAESIEHRAKSVVQKNSKPYALSPTPIEIFGRIEGYDISNLPAGKAGISNAVGSMVVFSAKGGSASSEQEWGPDKSQYRRFKIKTVSGINDVAMMREVLKRRFSHSKEQRAESREQKKSKPYAISPTPAWPLPDLLVIDGGWGQVNVAQEVIDNIRRQGLRSGRRPCLTDIPIIGIAKGFKRKQDRPIFDKDNPELARIVKNYKNLLLQVRDEAHRFAVAYHRKVRSRRLST